MIIYLGDGIAVAVIEFCADFVGADNFFKNFRMMLFQPAEKGRAEVETYTGIIIYKGYDSPESIEAPRA